MRVLLVATGGTIASRPRPGDGAVTVALAGTELLERAGLATDEIDVIDAARGPSWSFGTDAALDIARTTIRGATSGAHAGVVVTHGTDTVEETMFLTWLVGGAAASERCPIVFTAAMRHDADPAADGPANLRDAVDLATKGGAPGPVLAVAGETHHARWVTKTDTSAVDSFRSPGALGATSAPQPPPPHGDDVERRVAQVHAHTGIDPDVLDWHLGRGARGLVVEGTGAGNVHGDLVPGIERAIAAGVPVVVTSRCLTGSVSPTYGGPGGGRQLADVGCIAGGDLPTHKARIALSVALGLDDDPDAVRSWFSQLVGST